MSCNVTVWDVATCVHTHSGKNLPAGVHAFHCMLLSSLDKLFHLPGPGLTGLNLMVSTRQGCREVGVYIMQYICVQGRVLTNSFPTPSVRRGYFPSSTRTQRQTLSNSSFWKHSEKQGTSKTNSCFSDGLSK